MHNICRNPLCGKSFEAKRVDAKFCSPRCRTAACRASKDKEPPLPPLWSGKMPVFSTARRAKNGDGTPALSKAELADVLERIAREGDDGEPKTGRRFYYLALSEGAVKPDMGESDEAKKSRAAAYGRILDILGDLRCAGRIGWEDVIDLTRDVDMPLTFASPADMRDSMRRAYDEDRWADQPIYPVLVIEKDTMEPTCKPIAKRWHIPFLSSRGYGSLSIQHEVAKLANSRWADHRQLIHVLFVSDLDPSGIGLQESWGKTLNEFGATHVMHRIGLTPEQVAEHDLDRFALKTKGGDAREKGYRAVYGDRCWEADVLPVSVIGNGVNEVIECYLDRDKWEHNEARIKRIRTSL